MAEIRPFLGLRYQPVAGALDTLTAPPYDVISPEYREELAARNPFNIVHITLPEEREDERSKFVKYARSAATLSAWRREGQVAPEPAPAIYRYTQRFTLGNGTEVYERTSFIALLKVEPYANGIVLPHEQTFPKHKADRLRVLEATRSHLESIFGLYEDSDGSILAALKAAPAATSVSVRSDDGVDQVLEPITDAAVIEHLQGLVRDKKVWIADGHHRYETALTFREARGEQDHLIPEDFMMMAFSSLSDPGLVLMPTHRILDSLPVSQTEMIEKLSTDFDLVATPNTGLMGAVEIAVEEGGRAFGLALPGDTGYLMLAKDSDRLEAMVDGEVGADLKALDVTILHSVILEKLLGVAGLDAIRYTRDEAEAEQSPNHGAAAAFLMVPPTVDDMRTISLGGEKMPQKSTYYFPKILSGLVLWSLNDFMQ